MDSQKKLARMIFSLNIKEIVKYLNVIDRQLKCLKDKTNKGNFVTRNETRF